MRSERGMSGFILEAFASSRASWSMFLSTEIKIRAAQNEEVGWRRAVRQHVHVTSGTHMSFPFSFAPKKKKGQEIPNLPTSRTPHQRQQREENDIHAACNQR